MKFRISYIVLPVLLLTHISGCNRNPIRLEGLMDFHGIVVTDAAGNIIQDIPVEWVPRAGTGLFHLSIAPPYPNPSEGTIRFRFSVRDLSIVTFTLFRNLKDSGSQINRQMVDYGAYDWTYDFTDPETDTLLEDGIYRIVISAETADERIYSIAGNIQKRRQPD
ncbi:MAG TPA: hypothetical protein ENN03_07965 [bacterium]|nr:hypothetical protein [bacterium]